MTAEIPDVSRNVRVRIRRLALDGFDLDARQRRAVRAGVEQELARLLATAPLPARLQRGGSLPRPPGGAPRTGAWSDPGDLGRQVARAVHEGLHR